MDEEEGLSIAWNVHNKVKQVTKDLGNGDERIIKYEYDAMGNRVVKETFLNGIHQYTSYYANDASGNVMGIYRRNYPEGYAGGTGVPYTCGSCDVTLDDQQQTNYTITTGQVACIPLGTTYTGDVTVSGGTLVICGEANISNFTMSSGIVSVNGSANFGSISIAGEFNIYGFAHINGDFTINTAEINNYHTVGVTGTTTINSAATFNLFAGSNWETLNLHAYAGIDGSGTLETGLTPTGGTPVDQNSTLVLVEQAIYGSERIGQYQPNLEIYEGEEFGCALTGFEVDHQESTPSAISKWLVNSGSVMHFVDFTNEGVESSNSIGDANSSGINPSITVSSDNEMVLGAFENSGAWSIVNSCYNTIELPTGITLSSPGVDKTTALFIQNSLDNNLYYFVYPTSSSYSPYKYIEIDISAKNGRGEIISTSEENIASNNFGNNFEAISYADGNSRLFFYTNPTNSIEVYSIDVLHDGIQAPVLRGSVTTTGSAVLPASELVISPGGKYLAIGLHRSTTSTTKTYEDLVVWQMEADGDLVNSSVYDVTDAVQISGGYRDGNIDHLAFSQGSKYIYYTLDHDAEDDPYLGRVAIGESTSTEKVPFYEVQVGSNSTDIQRSVQGEILIQTNAQSLASVTDPELSDENDVESSIVTNVATLGSGNYESSFSRQIISPLHLISQAPEVITKTELNNWIIGTRAADNGDAKTELVFLGESSDPIKHSNCVYDAEINVGHNVAVAENANGTAVAKFFVAEEDQNIINGFDGLVKKYYDNQYFDGAPETIDIVSDVEVTETGNEFAIEWTGKIALNETGDYQFKVQKDSDDDVEIYLNGQQFFQAYNYATEEESDLYSVTVAGDVDIKIEYIEETGSQSLTLLWKEPGESTYTEVPASAYSHEEQVGVTKIGEGVLINGSGTQVINLDQEIKAEREGQSIFVKAPGNNDIWHLITHEASKVYSHTFNVATGELLSSNNILKDANDVDLYPAHVSDVSMAVYYDNSTGQERTKLYIGYAHINPPNPSLKLVDYEITTSGVEAVSNIMTLGDAASPPNGRCLVGELQLSPNGDQLSMTYSIGVGSNVEHRLGLFDIADDAELTTTNDFNDHILLQTEARASSNGTDRVKYEGYSHDYTESGDYIYYLEGHPSKDPVFFEGFETDPDKDFLNHVYSGNYSSKIVSIAATGAEAKAYTEKLIVEVEEGDVITVTMKGLKESSGNGTNAMMVMEIRDENNDYVVDNGGDIWKSNALAVTGNWETLTRSYTVPSGTGASEFYLNAYAWNKTDSPAWFDHLTVTVNGYDIDYYPESVESCIGCREIDVKRLTLSSEYIAEVTNNVDLKVANYNGQIRRGRNHRLYVNNEASKVITATSSLIELNSVEAPTITSVSTQTYDLGTGYSNTGLPLQPYHKFEEELEVGTIANVVIGSYSRAVDSRVYESKDHLGNVRATLADVRVTDFTVTQGDIDSEDMESVTYSDNTYFHGGAYAEKVDNVNYESESVTLTTVPPGKVAKVTAYVYYTGTLNATPTWFKWERNTGAQSAPTTSFPEISESLVADQWNKITLYIPNNTENNREYFAFVSYNGTTPLWVDDLSMEYDDISIASAETKVLSWQDYYAFGMVMPGRSGNFNDQTDGANGSSPGYRYGFNGKEMDDEVSGRGGHIDYGFRRYDPRLGRFLSVDPLSSSYPFYTPYQYAGNKPVKFIDLDGLEEAPSNGDELQNTKTKPIIEVVHDMQEYNQTLNDSYSAIPGATNTQMKSPDMDEYHESTAPSAMWKFGMWLESTGLGAKGDAENSRQEAGYSTSMKDGSHGSNDDGAPANHVIGDIELDLLLAAYKHVNTARKIYYDQKKALEHQPSLVKTTADGTLKINAAGLSALKKNVERLEKQYDNLVEMYNLQQEMFGGESYEEPTGSSVDQTMGPEPSDGTGGVEQTTKPFVKKFPDGSISHDMLKNVSKNASILKVLESQGDTIYAPQSDKP